MIEQQVKHLTATTIPHPDTQYYFTTMREQKSIVTQNGSKFFVLKIVPAYFNVRIWPYCEIATILKIALTFSQNTSIKKMTNFI